MNEVVFLTGATGFIGGNIAARILKRNPRTRLIVLVRGTSTDEASDRFWKTILTIDPEIRPGDMRSRVSVVRGDIASTNLGMSRSDLEKVVEETTHVIHSAASVEFNFSLEEARVTNCTGTNNVMATAKLAFEQGRVQRIGYISTAYVSGNREGTIYEHELDHRCGFANTYEQTKNEAEQAVRRLAADLPIVVLRPSIVIGDSQTGITTSFNVLYAPLRFVLQGLLPCLPGSPSTPLDVVPVDFVRDAICHITLESREGIGKTFHLTASENAATTREIVARTVEFFNETMEKRRVENVHFLPANGFRLALHQSRPGSGAAEKLISMFESYLCHHRLFDNSNTNEILKETAIRAPRFEEYYRTILGYFVRSFWGREMKKAA
ncbi:MAG: SDR family oxidoreductase [Ignavibacteriales bacterium]|nr:SDR family oxidoreductase [Ignavibacteriales bacterium]